LRDKVLSRYLSSLCEGRRLARKILLADDSVTAQNMGRKILADAGYDVSTVNNGSAALKRIAEIKPDLIVLDVYMPGYSGLEVCQRLKDSQETAHIPVLLTVGKLEPFKPEEARRVRADAHIIKPFEASELLTAITRLEDRMVPQADGTRFSTSVSGVERFGGDSGRKAEGDSDTDTGWKSRLRFPSKKKKEEPEPEPEAEEVAASFKDYRKGKGKAGAKNAITVKAPPPPGQEPGLVPDIPRDITPDELDALSALVAKLDGPIPAAENIAPLAEATRQDPVETALAAVAAAKAEAANTEVPAAAVEAEAATKQEEIAEVETPAAVVEPAPSLVAATVAEAKSEIEIPVAHIEPTTTEAVAVANPAAVEISKLETKAPETPAAIVTVPVNIAALAQDPAPVDKTDEPMFASRTSAVEAATEEKIEAKVVDAVATAETPEPSTASAPAEAVVAEKAESKIEVSKPEELKAENVAPPPTIAARATEPEEPAPSDEELAEALCLLTPAVGSADASFSQNTIPSHGTLVAAGQLLAEEAARNAAAGPRWIAEAIALSPEEAAISLEDEMFRTFAAAPAGNLAMEPEAGRVTGVSAIAAAVENRLAEAGLGFSAPTLPERADAEAPAVENLAVAAPVSNEASSLVQEVAPAPVAVQLGEVAQTEAVASNTEPEQKKAPAAVAEEASATEVAATFADAVGKNEIDVAAEEKVETVSGTTDVDAVAAAITEENQDLSSDSGGPESMGKDGKGKSTWHQIRNAPATAGPSNSVEEAKQAAAGASGAEAPKAMAAAAAADGSSSGSSPDASTIASIVDSVMADLRPKIVEEIAKKLAGK
jgi:CheY-like chemotaxis protein